MFQSFDIISFIQKIVDDRSVLSGEFHTIKNGVTVRVELSPKKHHLKYCVIYVL